MADNPFLKLIHEGWQAYQDHLIRAISPLNTEQLALRISPDLRSVMTLAAHIIATRVWWFRYVMQAGPAEVEPMVKWDVEGEPSRSASELITGLETSWAIIESGLMHWSAADMAEVFDRPGGDKSRSYSRQWIVWHVLEHDLHHGGELSFALGAHGLPAIDI